MDIKHISCLIRKEAFEKEFELTSAPQQPEPLAWLFGEQSCKLQIPVKFSSSGTAPSPGAGF